MSCTLKLWSILVSASSASSRERLSRKVCSVLRRSVTSRNTSTTPNMLPLASRMGEALSSIGRSTPSLATSSVWFASPDVDALFERACRGIVAVWPVAWSTMWNTRSSGWPMASRAVHPVRGFGDRVDAGDTALHVGRDHRVANARQRHPQLVAMARQLGRSAPLAAQRAVPEVRGDDDEADADKRRQHQVEQRRTSTGLGLMLRSVSSACSAASIVARPSRSASIDWRPASDRTSSSAAA
jgi:hypothetical protein